ncbi:TonB family protein [Spirosoma sp. RP8]|uniref:TonB family protein n=1 Tax=Spirosoma liriopis TaxID=2937440 RepID=A0ABT0HJR8_9BACT|nr:M56 family metallopeptidase [Spirosoma liriopis]MCK8492387.1 TonB family protein [Spirosoma liriopis]
MTALDYFLKANLYGLLFASCYWLLLRRHTFFGLNRAYLLVSVLLTLALPLVSLPTQTVEELPVPTGVLTIPIATLPAVEASPSVAETGLNWELWGRLAYALVAFGLLTRLIIQIRSLLLLIRRAPRQVRDGYTLVEINDATTPTFSFFRFIILNPADRANDQILKHKLIHVRQQHSIDVMSLALLRIVFWACPALWLLDRMLRQVHEFTADQHADQPTRYAHFLVEYSFGLQPSPLTNGFFNPSLLKQRIQMLHRQATTRWALGKYVLILPLALTLLAMTTAQKQIEAVVHQATDETITVSGRVTNEAGKPLAGGHVGVGSTGKGTITDRNGYYTIANVPKSSQLAYSHLGYRMDVLRLDALDHRIRRNTLTMNHTLTAVMEDELPAMGATAMYRAIKPNPAMPLVTPPSSQTINGKVYTAVEEKAVFPTGIPGLMQYVAHALRYPAKAKAAGIEGDVYVLFTVLPTGAVSEASVNKNSKRLGGGCEEEAMRVVSQMPNWIPAKQNGKAVAVRYQLPIRFTLEKNEDKRTGQLNTGDPAHKPIVSFSTPPDTGRKQASTITIRGRGPLGQLGPGPLYILDGVEVPGDTLASMDRKTINSIDALRDASAIAQYGEKGRNGVVIITTKKQ